MSCLNRKLHRWNCECHLHCSHSLTTQVIYSLSSLRLTRLYEHEFSSFQQIVFIFIFTANFTHVSKCWFLGVSSRRLNGPWSPCRHLGHSLSTLLTSLAGSRRLPLQLSLTEVATWLVESASRVSKYFQLFPRFEYNIIFRIHLLQHWGLFYKHYYFTIVYLYYN